LKSLGRFCRSLKVLILESCNKIMALTHVLQNCREIQHLSASYCKSITDASFEFKDHTPFRDFTSLELFNCQNITDKTLRQISLKFPNIRRLNLDRCVQITNGGMEILQSLEFLNHVTIRRCRLIRSQYLCNACAMWPDLEVLAICQCKQLSDETLQEISKTCRKMKKLYVLDLDITPAPSFSFKTK